MNPKQITRAILGIAIALGVSSFTTGTKEALATTEVLDHPKENKNRNDIASLVLKTRMQKKLMSN